MNTQEQAAFDLMREALKMAILQNSHDMLMTGEELRKCEFALAAAKEVQPQAQYDKTELNAFVQNLYDAKIAEGKHGHYETLFHVVHQAIKRVQPQAQAHPTPVHVRQGPDGPQGSNDGVNWFRL